MAESHISRRNFVLGAGLTTTLPLVATQAADGDAPPVGADEALARLIRGNQRFVSGKPKHEHTNQAWRDSLVKGQHPFAVIVGCADSRVPIEFIFDQGFGDLFVIRNAGNVVFEDVLGSMEYAMLHLKTQLVVILGHEGCGAVTAALKSRAERAEEPPELQQVLSRIDPAIAHIDRSADDAIKKAVDANVAWSVRDLTRLQQKRGNPHVKAFSVVGAVYELTTGRVRIVPPAG